MKIIKRQLEQIIQEECAKVVKQKLEERLLSTLEEQFINILVEYGELDEGIKDIVPMARKAIKVGGLALVMSILSGVAAGDIQAGDIQAGDSGKAVATQTQQAGEWDDDFFDDDDWDNWDTEDDEEDEDEIKLDLPDPSKREKNVTERAKRMITYGSDTADHMELANHWERKDKKTWDNLQNVARTLAQASEHGSFYQDLFMDDFAIAMSLGWKPSMGVSKIDAVISKTIGKKMPEGMINVSPEFLKKFSAWAKDSPMGKSWMKVMQPEQLQVLK